MLVGLSGPQGLGLKRPWSSFAFVEAGSVPPTLVGATWYAHECVNGCRVYLDSPGYPYGARVKGRS